MNLTTQCMTMRRRGWGAPSAACLQSQCGKGICPLHLSSYPHPWKDACRPGNSEGPTTVHWRKGEEHLSQTSIPWFEIGEGHQSSTFSWAQRKEKKQWWVSSLGWVFFFFFYVNVREIIFSLYFVLSFCVVIFIVFLMIYSAARTLQYFVTFS